MSHHLALLPFDRSMSPCNYCFFLAYDNYRTRKTLWGSRIKRHPPSVKYEDVMSVDGNGLYQWLSKIVRSFLLPISSREA
jgi:hypothetical protein